MLILINDICFLPHDAIHSMDYAIARCPSVYPSHASVLSKRPDPDHSPDAGTGLLSPISYRLRNFAA